MPVTEAQLKKFHHYRKHFGDFCHNILRIKDQNAQLVPLILKPVQIKIAEYLIECWIENKPIRLIVLKARREGVSTLVAAFYYWITSMNNNYNCYMLSNDETGASYIFDMHQIFYDEMDDDIRPMRRHNNRKILRFENPNDEQRTKIPGRRSEIRVGSAKTKKVGSGYMTNLLHVSELAKCEKPEETMISIKQSIPKPPKWSSSIIESTAFGAGNYFHKEWKRAEAGQSEYTPLFFPWFDEPEYSVEVPAGFMPTEYEAQLKKKFKLTDGQIAWRRRSIRDECDGDENIFKQEYPSTPDEAFLVSGRGVFAPSTLAWHEAHSPKEILWRGNIAFNFIEHRGAVRQKAHADEDARGALTIYAKPDRKNEMHYALGADVAEGIDVSSDKYSKGDRSSVHILCQETGQQVAKYVDWISPDHFANVIFYMGRMYNNAYCGIESNNHGLVTLTCLRDLDYPLNLIHHSIVYGESYEDGTEKLGWLTNRRTKPLLIDTLSAGLRDKEIWGLDSDTIAELRTYTKDGRGRMGGEQGCYDDQVISLGIAYMMLTTMREIKGTSKKLPAGVRKFNTSSIEMGQFALTG